MKKIVFYCLLVILVSCSTGKLALEKEIKGTWVVNQSNPKNSDLRTVTLKHGKFKSEAMSGDNFWLYNQGNYAVINDSLLVTVHKGRNGELGQFANLYTIKIEGDTLHFYGYYLQPHYINNKKGVVQSASPAYIDEIWVKE